jgi:Uncharacterized vancomycin resistance protein
MRTSTGRFNKKHLILALLFISFLGLASCKSEDGIKKPEETVRNDPPAKAIEFTANERSIRKDVYLKDENVGGLKESEILEKLGLLAGKINTDSVDATMDSDTWKVTKGKVGKKVNVEKTLELLLNAPEGAKVDLAVEEAMPAVTSQKLLGNIVVIGNYTTKLLNRGESRVNNIDLAAEKIDYYKLSPGEVFSFNKVVGRRTEAKGYEDAPIIIKTVNGPKKSIAVGGGICQVSTTLYNALEECKIEIVERHLHSKDVGYVPKGEDATVSYGSADFRFKNSRSHPIMIRTYLGKKYLTIKILENRNL